jgi:endonuclease I
LKTVRLFLALGLMVVSASACAQSPSGVAKRASGLNGVSARAVVARAEPAGYYAAAEGKQGQELLRTLAGVVTKHKDLGYDAARDAMFSEVDDLDGDNVVECDYTGRSLSNITDRQSAYYGGKGFNAEHTWPQSKGAVGAAKADLNHLFPTDCHANSVRSSYPFGDVAKVEWTEGGSSLGTNAKGQTVFQPRADQKGNTARAILYFYMVYGQRADLGNFRIEEETLKRWHQEDPVTEADRARNDAVQRAQGNRNPFVDHPEFVGAVGSFLSSGSRMPAFTF